MQLLKQKKWFIMSGPWLLQRVIASTHKVKTTHSDDDLRQLQNITKADNSNINEIGV